MKRILSILLALALILTAFCIPAIAEDKVTLKVTVGPGTNSFFAGEDENNNHIINYIEETTGIDVEWFILPTGSDQEKLNAMMASPDEVPDVFMISNRDMFLQYASNGLILPLDEYISDRDEYFKYDLIGANRMGVLDGQTYAIATPGNQSASTYTWWYDVEALKNAGIEIEGHELTLDRFTEILYQLKETYPDKIALGCTSDGTTSPMVKCMQAIYGAFAIANDFRVDADGKLEYAYATEDMKECLQYINKLYTDGILDPEFLVSNADNLLPKLMEKQCVSFLGEWYNYTGTYRNNIESQDPETGAWSNNWQYVNIIDGGKATKGQTTGSLNQWYMCVSYNCKNPQAAVDLMNLFLTPGYYDICFYGHEGVDFMYDEEGHHVRIAEGPITQGYKDANGTQQYFVYYYFTEAKEQRMDRIASGDPNYETDKCLGCWYGAKVVDNPLAAITVVDEYTDGKADLNDTAAAYIIKFIMGEYSFDQWDAYLNALESVNVNTILDALNAWYETL